MRFRVKIDVLIIVHILNLIYKIQGHSYIGRCLFICETQSDRGTNWRKCI